MLRTLYLCSCEATQFSAAATNQSVSARSTLFSLVVSTGALWTLTITIITIILLINATNVRNKSRTTLRQFSKYNVHMCRLLTFYSYQVVNGSWRLNVVGGGVTKIFLLVLCRSGGLGLGQVGAFNPTHPLQGFASFHCPYPPLYSLLSGLLITAKTTAAGTQFLFECFIFTKTHTHNRFTALLGSVWDYPGEQVPER